MVRRYLLLAGLYTLSASLIWGVNTLFLLDAGLDIAQVFVANAAFTAAMVAFEIPTGVVADTLGRRTSFLASMAVLFAATVAYALAGVVEAGLPVFLGASIALGLGFTFYSGATEAWLVDALKVSGYEGSLDRVFSRGQVVTGMAMMVGTLAGGALGGVDLVVPFVVRAGLLAVVFIVAFVGMHDVGFRGHELSFRTVGAELTKVAKASVRYGVGSPSVRLLVLVPFFQFGFFMWGWYAWQPYLLDLLGRDDIWISGVISAAIALATIGGNALVRPLGHLFARRTTLMAVASGVETASAVGIGLVDHFAPAFSLLALFGVAMGVMGPVRQAYLHESIPSEQRATLVSFDSLVGNLGSVGGQVVLGRVARDRGIADGYVYGGLFTIFALPLVLVLRSLGGRPDVIVSERPAQDAPCAGQGMPAGTQVDAVARTPADQQRANV